MAQRKKTPAEFRAVVSCLRAVSRRHARALRSRDCPALGGAGGLRRVQRLSEHQAARLSVRRIAPVRGYPWVLPLALFCGNRAFGLPDRSGKPGQLSRARPARLSRVPICQSRSTSDNENLSSLYRTKSVLLRARLFSRRRRVAGLSAGRRARGEESGGYSSAVNKEAADSPLGQRGAAGKISARQSVAGRVFDLGRFRIRPSSRLVSQ